MTEDSTLSYDSVGLPQFEKVTLTIVRKLSESERKKSHREYVTDSTLRNLALRDWRAAKEGKPSV